MDNDFFLVQLSSNEDVFKVVLGYLWIVMGQRLSVQQCYLDFRVTEANIFRVAVRVRSPRILPLQYYHETVLTRIRNMIGRTMKVNYNTLTAQIGRFCKSCYEA